jgi:hypothetical protein
MSYPTTTDIETGTWGAVLVIDPNGLRTFSPVGPLYYKLDSLRIQPGLTDRGGVFTATLNDNKNDSRTYDMMLLTPLSTYIRDNDEFWVGVQYGPVAEGLSNTWDGSTGRYWFMGGWITRRYYTYNDNGDITAVIEGKDYMDLWRTQPYGTPEDPKDYSETPGLHSAIADDLFTEVNSLQLANYQFTKHGTYWDTGSMTGEIQRNMRSETAFDIMEEICREEGYDWQIQVDPTGATPADRRVVMLYARDSTNMPIVNIATRRIAYDQQVRSIPTLQLGDTEDVATHIIITTEKETVPPEISNFMQPGLWPDKDDMSTRYSILSFPSPRNWGAWGWEASDDGSASYGQLTEGPHLNDVSQVMDDEEYPAVNFQKLIQINHPERRSFWNFLNFYNNPDDRPAGAALDLDLRKWRRLKFKFKHNTRRHYLLSGGPADELDWDEDSVYKVRLHTNVDGFTGSKADWYKRAFVYTFGTGYQDLYDLGEDRVTGAGWTMINLLLPELDADGNVINWNGWSREYTVDPIYPPVTADPTSIDFVSFEIECAEGTGSPANWSSTLSDARSVQHYRGYFVINDVFHSLTDPETRPAVGDLYLAANNLSAGELETYFYWGSRLTTPTITGEIVFAPPYPRMLITTGSIEQYSYDDLYEWVEVEAINGDWGNDANGDPYVIRLVRPLTQNYGAFNNTEPNVPPAAGLDLELYIPFGVSWSLSQLRFEKGGGYVIPVTRPTELQKPYRYRLVASPEVDVREQAEFKATKEIFNSTQHTRIKLDGNPYYLIGYLVNPQLDPGRETIFHNVWHCIDDIDYVVDGTDFYSDITIGPLGERAKRIVDLIYYQTQQSRKTTRVDMDSRSGKYAESFTG